MMWIGWTYFLNFYLYVKSLPHHDVKGLPPPRHTNSPPTVLSTPAATLLSCAATAIVCLFFSRVFPEGAVISRRPLSWDTPPLAPLSTVRPAPTFIFALITAAHVPDHFDEQQQRLRDHEYALSLDFFFPRFGDRVAGVIAGGPGARGWPLLLRYHFSRLEFFNSMFSQKSAKESQGIQRFVRAITSGEEAPEGADASFSASWSSIGDDDVVFKTSGRYQIVRDDFVDEIAKTRDSFDAWAKTFGAWKLDKEGQHQIERGEKKIFTFCWAMKWRHFKDLYLNIDLEKLERFDGNKGW